MTILLAATGDEHVNCRAGLCFVRIEVDSKIVLPTPTQVSIRNAYGSFWDTVEQRAEAVKADEIWWVQNGDAVDINKKDKLAPITLDKEEIKDHTAAAYKRPAELSARRFFVHGTEVHAGPHCEMEDGVADDLGGVPNTDDGKPAWWWLPLWVEGVKFDILHHPRYRSRSEWGMTGAAEREVTHTLLRYADLGERAPDVILRSHVHVFNDSGERQRARAFYLDGWQAMVPFVYGLGYTAPMAVGGMIFVCRDSKYTHERLWWRPKRTKTWKAS